LIPNFIGSFPKLKWQEKNKCDTAQPWFHAHCLSILSFHSVGAAASATHKAVPESDPVTRQELLGEIVIQAKVIDGCPKDSGQLLYTQEIPHWHRLYTATNLAPAGKFGRSSPYFATWRIRPVSSN
jgi:hypothetical protein